MDKHPFTSKSVPSRSVSKLAALPTDRNAFQRKPVTRDLSTQIEDNLSRLFECLKLEYGRQILVSPKWKNFGSQSLQFSEKTRLNNAIWRCWHIQYQKNKRPLFCQFVSPLSAEREPPKKPLTVVLQGRYWRRKLDAIAREYKKWRIYYKHKNEGRDEKQRTYSTTSSIEDDNKSSASPLTQIVDSMDYELTSDLVHCHPDTLFTSKTKQIVKPSVSEIVFQPSLDSLQPNLDEFTKHLERLVDTIVESNEPIQIPSSFVSLQQDVQGQADRTNQQHTFMPSSESFTQFPLDYGNQMEIQGYDSSPISQPLSHESIPLAQLEEEPEVFSSATFTEPIQIPTSNSTGSSYQMSPNNPQSSYQMSPNNPQSSYQMSPNNPPQSSYQMSPNNPQMSYQMSPNNQQTYQMSPNTSQSYQMAQSNTTHGRLPYRHSSTNLQEYGTSPTRKARLPRNVSDNQLSNIDQSQMNVNLPFGQSQDRKIRTKDQFPNLVAYLQSTSSSTTADASQAKRPRIPRNMSDSRLYNTSANELFNFATSPPQKSQLEQIPTQSSQQQQAGGKTRTRRGKLPRNMSDSSLMYMGQQQGSNNMTAYQRRKSVDPNRAISPPTSQQKSHPVFSSTLAQQHEVSEAMRQGASGSMMQTESFDQQNAFMDQLTEITAMPAGQQSNTASMFNQLLNQSEDSTIKDKDQTNFDLTKVLHNLQKDEAVQGQSTQELSQLSSQLMSLLQSSANSDRSMTSATVQPTTLASQQTSLQQQLLTQQHFQQPSHQLLPKQPETQLLPQQQNTQQLLQQQQQHPQSVLPQQPLPQQPQLLAQQQLKMMQQQQLLLQQPSIAPAKQQSFAQQQTQVLPVQQHKQHLVAQKVQGQTLPQQQQVFSQQQQQMQQQLFDQQLQQQSLQPGHQLSLQQETAIVQHDMQAQDKAKTNPLEKQLQQLLQQQQQLKQQMQENQQSSELITALKATNSALQQQLTVVNQQPYSLPQQAVGFTDKKDNKTTSISIQPKPIITQSSPSTLLITPQSSIQQTSLTPTNMVSLQQILQGSPASQVKLGSTVPVASIAASTTQQAVSMTTSSLLSQSTSTADGFTVNTSPQLSAVVSTGEPSSGGGTNSAKFTRPVSSSDREHYREHRRQSHISAEQKRRFNIKVGFDQLISLVPALACQKNSKVSKAMILHKSHDYITKLQRERNKVLEEQEILRKESQQLFASISQCQQKLPAFGVPLSRQRNDQMLAYFNQYVKSRTQENYKFWVLSVMFRQMFESYNQKVTGNTWEEFCTSILSWMDDQCTLPTLRPAVLSALRDISRKTSILTNPARLPQEIKQHVASHEDPTNLTEQTQTTAVATNFFNNTQS